MYITQDGYLFANALTIKNATQTRVFVNPQHNLYIETSSSTKTESSRLDLLYAYPNPVKDGRAKLRFKIGFSGNGRIDFINFSGTLVKSQMFNFTGGSVEEIPLDLSGLEPDMYYLDIKFNGESLSLEKVIKLFIVAKGARK